MGKKQKKSLNDNKLREIKISDSLTNLEEFTRIMTEDIDFDSFDILSVTRIDTDDPYTKKFAHPQLGEAPPVASQSDRIRPMGITKNKLN